MRLLNALLNQVIINIYPVLAAGSVDFFLLSITFTSYAKTKNMLVHHVLFWLKKADSAEDREKLQEGLSTLKTIEQPRLITIGTPATTDRPVIDRSYSFSLMILFDSMEQHDAYQVHPVHKNFIKEYAHLWSKVVIYDAQAE